QRQLFFKCCEQGQLGLWTQHRRGVWPKRQGDRGGAFMRRDLLGPGKQALMTTMHAVESAYGEHRRSKGRHPRSQVILDAHNPLFPGVLGSLSPAIVPRAQRRPQFEGQTWLCMMLLLLY